MNEPIRLYHINVLGFLYTNILSYYKTNSENHSMTASGHHHHHHHLVLLTSLNAITSSEGQMLYMNKHMISLILYYRNRKEFGQDL